jgi:hypothetical protein
MPVARWQLFRTPALTFTYSETSESICKLRLAMVKVKKDKVHAPQLYAIKDGDKAPRILTSAVDGCEWSALRLDRLP